MKETGELRNSGVMPSAKMPNGLSFPLWVESSVFKQGNKYYLVIINGSHVAADQLGDPLLYGFYRMERSSQ